MTAAGTAAGSKDLTCPRHSPCRDLTQGRCHLDPFKDRKTGTEREPPARALCRSEAEPGFTPRQFPRCPYLLADRHLLSEPGSASTDLLDKDLRDEWKSSSGGDGGGRPGRGAELGPAMNSPACPETALRHLHLT